MPKRGDRVVFEGMKVGGGRREGELVEMSGRSVRIRWADGTESLLIPGPGAMQILPKAPRPARAAVAKRSPAKAAGGAGKERAKSGKPAPKASGKRR